MDRSISEQPFEPDNERRWIKFDGVTPAARVECSQKLKQFNDKAWDKPRQDVREMLIDLDILGTVGDQSVIWPSLICNYGRNIHIGDMVGLNRDCVLLDDAPIVLADSVIIGPRTQLITPIHPTDDHESRRGRWETAEPIHIGSNTWLGAGVIVLPGVTIGSHSVIGAGSVVIHDVDDYTFAAGSPARPIKRLHAPSSRAGEGSGQ